MERQSLLIEPHYFPNLEFFARILSHDEVTLEINDHFIKQTYRNRCEILTSNGLLSLSVPVRYGNRTPMGEVKIDYAQSWVKDHARAIRSAYANAPFFDFFADHFFTILHQKHDFLVDLDMKILTKCLELLQQTKSFSYTETYSKSTENDILDLRNQIHPKKSFTGREFYVPVAYIQTFGSKFVPNLSVLDALMCEGPGAFQVIAQSKQDSKEQK